MGSGLQAGAVIAAAPIIRRKAVKPVIAPTIEAAVQAVAAAEGVRTPEQEEGDGEDSEPPSLGDYWNHRGPTLVCPGLGLFASKE
jgi:hypothetical protein